MLSKIAIFWGKGVPGLDAGDRFAEFPSSLSHSVSLFANQTELWIS